MNTAIVYMSLKDYGKAGELYERVLDGYEAQLGKDHEETKRCSRNFKTFLNASGDSERLAQLITSYSGLAVKK
ncbi:hypothetical protein TL16_g08265 [Triparma laevis f. inornata]|uniref:Kinesin light chain n=1 Tax=Triparma laevis f. inornata TaxID=1714386 RepID=A0A9W7B279_9STRA|nr:hypothetical protein TL16_g08265 [Triparma laevis f. inornata]